MNCSVITESSATLSQSTPQNVSSGTMASNTAFYNPSDQKFYGAYQVYTSPYACKNYLLTVSGTTFTFVDGVDMPNATDRGVWTQGIYIADITKGAFVGQTNNGYDLLTSIISLDSTTSSNLTTNNYFGIAAETKSNGQDVKVTRPGSLNKNQSGMSAGKDMYVTDAGLIKKRTTTTTTTNSNISSSNGNEIASLQSNENDMSVAYDTVNNKIGVLYTANSTNYPTIAIGSESNNSITWGTPVVVKSANTPQNYSGQKLAYGNGIFVATYVASGEGLLKAGVYSGTNSITLGSEIRPTTDTVYSYGGAIAYNPNANKFVYAFPEHNTSSIKLFLITNSSTTLTTGNSATITMGYSSNNKVIWNEYDPDTYKQVILTDHLYGSEGRIYQATISGANITVPSTHYAITDEATDELGSKALSYDPDNNKWILFKCNTGNVLRANVLTASGDTFTSGTVTQLSSQYMRWLAPYYDTEQNKTVLAYSKRTSPYNGEIGFVTISNTTPSFTASSTSIGNQTTERSQAFSSLYNPDTKSGIVVGATPQSSAKAVGFVLYYGTTSSTVVNGSQFVGVARSGTDLELSGPPSELVAMANGSITKGKPVILRTDGDFQQAGLVPTTIDYSAGTETAVSTEDNYFNGVSYDPDQNRYVAFYSESNFSYYGYAKSFTVTDKVISNIVGMGAFHTSSTGVLDCCYIGNSKHIVFFTDGSSYVNARVVQVASDGTATYGTKVTINSSGSESNGSCYYDSDKDVAVITMGMDSNTGKSIAVSVSGLTITAGSKVTVPSSDSNVYYTSSSYNTEEKIGLVVWDSGSTSKLNSATISLSGTGNRTITFNSVLEVYNGSTEIKKGSLTYDPVNKKHFLAYSDASNMKGVVLTVSGTSVTKGTSATIYSGGETNIATQGTDQGGISIYHRDASSPYYLKGVVATISGTDFTLSNEATLGGTELKNGRFGNAVYNPSDFTTTVIYVVTASYDLKATATIPNGGLSSTNLTSSNFIGFAENTVVDNEDVKVKVISQSDQNQTGLTIGSQYFVQTDGTLSTTAGTPSVLGGTALSSTSLLIKS